MGLCVVCIHTRTHIYIYIYIYIHIYILDLEARGWALNADLDPRSRKNLLFLISVVVLCTSPLRLDSLAPYLLDIVLVPHFVSGAQL